MSSRIVAVVLALAMPVCSAAWAQSSASEYEELQRTLEKKFAPPPSATRSPVPGTSKTQKDDFQWIRPGSQQKAPQKTSESTQKSATSFWGSILAYFKGDAAEEAGAQETLKAGTTRTGDTQGAATTRSLTPAGGKAEVQQIAQSEIPVAKRNSYVIQLKPSAKGNEIDDLLQKYNLKVTKTIAPLGVITVEVKDEPSATRSVGAPEAGEVDEPSDAKTRLQRILEPPLIRDLRSESIVNGAFVNSTMGAKIVPKPTGASVVSGGETFSWRWHTGEGRDGAWGLKAIRMPTVWTILDRHRKDHPDRKPPKIAIIDGGFVENPSITFNDMKGVRPFSFHTAGCDTHHGMHVAGIIGARHGESGSIDGMVPGARIDAIAIDDRILGDSAAAGIDEGWQVHTLLFDDVLLKTLDYITDNMTSPDDLRVINISLGYNFVARNLIGDTEPDEVPGLALHIVQQANLIRHVASRVEDTVLFVVAAGNDSDGRAVPLDTRWASPFAYAGTQDSSLGPASKNIIVVEAVGRDGMRASFSNTGGHVAAPGENIMSTLAGGQNALGVCSGTSQAAPFVAGLAAILFELDPSKTPAEVAAIIRGTARPAKDDLVATGTIDALSAVAELSPVNLRYAADLNGDSKVDEADMTVFARQLANIESAATTNAAFTEDLNGDGVIDDNECFWPMIDINGSGRGAASQKDARVMSGSRRSDLDVLALTWTDTAKPYEVALAGAGLGERPAEVLAATLGSERGTHKCRGLIAAAGVETAATDAGPTRSLGPAEGGSMIAATAAAGTGASGGAPSSDPEAVKARVEKAVEELRAKHPNVKVIINPATGMPSSITGLGPTPGSAGLGASSGSGDLTDDEVKRAVDGYFGQGGTLWAAFPMQNKQAKPVYLGQRKDPDFPGRSVAAVEQRVDGIRVFGSSCKLTVERALGVTNYMGSMSNVAIEDTKPSISEADAQKAAAKKLEELTQSAPDPSRAFPLGPQASEDPKPELMVFDPALVSKSMKGPTRLAYMVTLNAFRIFVDAHTGDVFYYYRDQPSGMVRRIFDLNQTRTFPGKKFIDEEIRTREENLTPEALSAFRNAGLVRDFFFLVFGRDSYNGTGGHLESYVRYGRPEAYWCITRSNDCPNANVMVYGLGFASAIDVVGHEMTHGIIAAEPNLIYHNESGAVNESLADIFGTLIEFEARGESGNWLIGENAPGFSFTEPLRSMAEPNLKDANGKSMFDRNASFSLSNRGQPDHYSEVLTDKDPLCASTFLADNGCVHFNSGILNKFAYLISEGGTHRGVTVSGIGRTKMGRIAYRTLIGLTASSGLVETATVFITSCEQLTQAKTAGISAADCEQVKAATRAVGLAQAGT